MIDALLTYHDAYEHLLDVFNLYGKDVSRVQRTLRRAVTEAARKISQMERWHYYQRQLLINTDTVYSTGTVAYTSSTRQLTLTGGTWPTNAAFGFVIIDDVRYPISRRISDTVVELEDDQNPGADIASGTSYDWQRFRYLLPIDCSQVLEVVDANHFLQLLAVHTRFSFFRQDILNTETFPTHYSVIRSPDYPGRWELWLTSAASSVRRLRVLYNARVAGGMLDEISTGTVTISANTDIATFSSGIVTEDWVGCVLRVGSGATPPTAREGSYRDGDHLLELPVAERVITARTNATTVVLNRPVTDAASAVGYTVSTHIDVNPEGMWELFLRLCELQYQILTREKPQVIQTAQSLMLEALRGAKRADVAPAPDTMRYRLNDKVVLDD